jgi:hypothetical protein
MGVFMKRSLLVPLFLFAALSPCALGQPASKSGAMDNRVPSDSPRAALKRVGPPAVSVEAQRLEGDRLQITFTYYAHGTGKLERVKCSGSISQIESEVRELGKQNRMSVRVQDLVEVALRRIRILDIPVKN